MSIEQVRSKTISSDLAMSASGGANSASDDASLLPEPLTSGGGADATELIALALIRAGSTERKSEHVAGDALDRAEVAANAERIRAMRDKASDLLTEGILTGSFQIAAGGLSVLGGMTTSDKTVLSRDISNAATHATEQTVHEVSMNTGYIYQAMGRGAEAVASIAGPAMKAAETTDDAVAARHESDASYARRASDKANDGAHEAKKMIDAALELYRQYKQAENDAVKASMHAA